MKIRIRNIRDDAWYEVFRMVLLFVIIAGLYVSVQATHSNRRFGGGNRAVNCAMLRLNIDSAMDTQKAQVAELVWEKNC